MSNRRNANFIQGRTDHRITAGEDLSTTLLEIIRARALVDCTISLKPGIVSIRTAKLADYFLAKQAIKACVGSREICRYEN